MADQTVPQGASAPLTRTAPSAVPPGTAALTDWRSAALALINAVLDCVDGARKIQPDACPETIQLLKDAAAVADAAESIPSRVDSEPYDMLREIYHLEALLKGACALEQTPRATAVLLSEILERLDASSALFDAGGLPERGVGAIASVDPDELRVSRTPRSRSPDLIRAGHVFSTIVSISSAIQTLCIDIVESATDEESANRAVAAKAMAAQIALLAEVGEQDVGGFMPSDHPDARAWLLPPAYHAVGGLGERQ